MGCFQTQMQFRVHFGLPWNEKSWHMYVIVIWNMYIRAICYIFGLFCNLVAIRYISFRLGILKKEKSGNPVAHEKTLFFYFDFFSL
jgi:hypothetical protein